MVDEQRALRAARNAAIFVFIAVIVGIPLAGYAPGRPALVACALVSAAYSALYVILGESLAEDVVKTVLLLALAVFAAEKLARPFVLPCAIISCASGCAASWWVRRKAPASGAEKK